MTLSTMTELNRFFSTYISDGEPEADVSAVDAFLAATGADQRQKVLDQLDRLIASSELSLEDLGTNANRWFGETGEARDWLTSLRSQIGSAPSLGGIVVKDSNGAVLLEGDSVLVIKDLKVRGGSSDLKRGTMIRKIHLVDDPEVIECRVDGSTLVLKTCFLKKA